MGADVRRVGHGIPRERNAEREREKQKGTITKAVNGTSPYRAKRNMEEDTEACSPSFESDCSVRGSALALSAHLCLSKSEKAEKAEAKSESERRARGAVEHHGADGGGQKSPGAEVHRQIRGTRLR